jgi:hypothetical protein
MRRRRALMAEANAAKRMTLSDRAVGEAEFQGLLATHPDDGMIYLKRGEACNRLGARDLAAADYRRAEGLLALEDWKVRACQALTRVGG